MRLVSYTRSVRRVKGKKTAVKFIQTLKVAIIITIIIIFIIIIISIDKLAEIRITIVCIVTYPDKPRHHKPKQEK